VYLIVSTERPLLLPIEIRDCCLDHPDECSENNLTSHHTNIG
jgi:hypothetical protein